MNDRDFTLPVHDEQDIPDDCKFTCVFVLPEWNAETYGQDTCIIHCVGDTPEEALQNAYREVRDIHELNPEQDVTDYFLGAMFRGRMMALDNGLGELI